VLYFYPKADTPGCTKQACAFRDSLSAIRKLGAEIFGVSADDVDALKKFKTNHNLNFVLLADPGMDAIKAYGSKMPVVSMSKRWTFIIDPDLKIRSIDKDVDPVLDAKRVAETLQKLQK
jgi:peroxiredoxin Q/BCP